MTARSEALRHQNEQVVTFTLVELLTQLVFVAMLLAIVLQSEALQDVNPSAERLRALEKQLALKEEKITALEDTVSSLKEQLAEQQELVRSLLGTKGTTLPFGVVAISREEADYLASLKASLAAQQRDSAKAQAELAAIKGGKGGSDRPNCIITSGFVLDIALLGNGSFQATPAWDKGARVAEVDGLSELASAGAVSAASFSGYAGRIQAWTNAQAVPCGFRVIARRRHGNITLFERQLRTVEQRFYVARR